MTNQRIQEILQDLYQLDPALKAHEPKLISLIEDLLREQPNAVFDEARAQELRHKLLAHASLSQSQRTPQRSGFWNAFRYFAAGTALTALIIGGYAYSQQHKTHTITTEDGIAFSPDVTVEPAASNAFGSLVQPTATRNAESDSASAGGQGGNPVPTSSKLAQGGGGYGGDATLPYYGVRYVYTGEPLEQTEAQLDVYRRQKGFSQTSDAQKLLKQFSLGLINANTFSNTTVDQLTFTEQKEYGYTVSISLNQGIIGIYQNWQRWPLPEKDCRTPECYEQLRLKPEDMPSNADVISIANQFLTQHGISTESYGKPEVLSFWREEYARAQDKSQIYIPDTLTVVYPLLINGEEVYDGGGNKTGLQVQVNVRVKKAAGINDLASQNYQSSKYSAETDGKRILSFLERSATPEATDTAELGTPSLGLMRYWIDRNGETEELIIPAYIFPVVKAPSSQYYYQKQVLIPLVKEVLDNFNNGPIIY